MEQFRTTLKANRRSVTHPREAVFMALQNQAPLSLNELVDVCPAIDRASVYRTVKLFENLGIAHRVQLGWKYKVELSDTFQRHHHHLTCRRCQCSFDLEEDNLLEERLRLLAARHGFRIEGHQLEIQGLCPVCRKS